MVINLWLFIQSINSWSSSSGKTNTLLNLINHEPDIDKIHLYAEDPFEAKYQLLIKKRESIGLKHLNNSEAFIEYSSGMDDNLKILNNIMQIRNEKYWSYLVILLLICLVIKKVNPMVTELFIRGRTLNIFLFLLRNLNLLFQKISD